MKFTAALYLALQVALVSAGCTDNADGFASLNGGTSAAAPIMASVITRINQERTAAGKGPVGYVNPVFYAHPEMFNDITDGNNPGCNTGGFKAVNGGNGLKVRNKKPHGLSQMSAASDDAHWVHGSGSRN